MNSVCLKFLTKIKKTKVKSIPWSGNVSIPIRINGNILKLVERFKYLGRWISNRLDPYLEIRSRIEQARNAS